MAARKSAPRTIRPGEAVMWLRMGDADREKLGGPEWVSLDVGALVDAPGSELSAWEAETGIPLYLMLHELPSNGSRATRMALFIARRKAGVTESWDEFDPATLRVQKREKRPPEAEQDGAGEGKPAARRRSATSPPGSAGAPSKKSSTPSARS